MSILLKDSSREASWWHFGYAGMVKFNWELKVSLALATFLDMFSGGNQLNYYGSC